MGSHELGQQHYQHPQRMRRISDRTWIGSLAPGSSTFRSPRCELDPTLWASTQAGDERLLFQRKDFEAPGVLNLTGAVARSCRLGTTSPGYTRFEAAQDSVTGGAFAAAFTVLNLGARCAGEHPDRASRLPGVSDSYLVATLAPSCVGGDGPWRHPPADYPTRVGHRPFTHSRDRFVVWSNVRYHASRMGTSLGSLPVDGCGRNSDCWHPWCMPWCWSLVVCILVWAY